jgi:hypothetical protein
VEPVNSVVSIATNELHIVWPDLPGVHFRLSRSNAIDSGFVVIQASLGVPFYTDATVNLYDEGNKYYYKVESLDGGGAVIGTSEILTMRYNNPDGVANKVISEARTVLRVMNNPLVYVLIRRRTGTHCSECWNAVTKRTKYANCSTCNGTGEMGGYYAPFPIRMSSDVSRLTNAADASDSDMVSLSPINAWTAETPLLTPDDVIADVNNRRYLVQDVMPRTKSQFVIRQVLQLVPLPKGHPAYQVVVNYGGGLR